MSFLITRTSRYGKKIAKFGTGLPKKLLKTKKKTSKSELMGMGLGAGVAVGGLYAYSKTPLAQQTQNQIIEMQKIDKERKAGKKFTRKQLTARLDKAKLSKREFTWI